MNNKKVCFITAVNDELTYEECLFYIKNLNTPDGYEVELIGVRDAYCMGYAYNKAIENSDAKYKVYLHQDTFIINKNFIHDILKIFENDNIGMIGVCGALNLPKNGVWWEDENKVGKIYDNHTNKMKKYCFNENKNKYEKVQVIDGLIMITQYDLEWKHEIFDGWHFYDLSKSFEFINKKYEVVVPRQIEPWCIHECGIANTTNGYEKYRNIFLNYYGLI